jgi:hypothetical protein
MEKDRKIILFITFVAIFVGGYYFFFANKQAGVQQVAKPEVVSNGDLVVKKIADKYQAAVGGEEELTYTIQAQKRFITDKPTLFTDAYVDDIFERDGKTFIRFSSSWFAHNNYVLELECNDEMVDKILGQKGGNHDFDGSYAVVASIQEVSKPARFELQGSLYDENKDIEIYINSSEVFIAKGTCIDIAYIEEERIP